MALLQELSGNTFPPPDEVNLGAQMLAVYPVPSLNTLVNVEDNLLPYTAVLGLPAGSRTYPLLINLRQKNFRGWEYWGATIEDALRMAAVGIESLTITTLYDLPSPFRQVQPNSLLLPNPEERLRFVAFVPQAVNTVWPVSLPNWTIAIGPTQWEEVLKGLVAELERRRSQNYRGAPHWVALFIGIGEGPYAQWIEEYQRLLQQIFEFGPFYAQWAVVVDVFEALPVWGRLPFLHNRLRLMGPLFSNQIELSQQMTALAHQLTGIRIDLRGLKPYQAFLVSRVRPQVLDIPKPTWAWGAFWRGGWPLSRPRASRQVLAMQPQPLPPKSPHLVALGLSGSRPSKAPSRQSLRVYANSR